MPMIFVYEKYWKHTEIIACFRHFYFPQEYNQSIFFIYLVIKRVDFQELLILLRNTSHENSKSPPDKISETVKSFQ
jgi:hypothetical protein